MFLPRALARPAALGLTLVVALVAAGSVATAANAGLQNHPDRTAVVGLEFDPPCLNPLLAECNVFVAHTVATTALAGAFRARPDLTFEPVLVDRVDVQSQPFALTYHIKRKAVWSDGTPVTADDFSFTVETILDPSNNTLRTGYERIVESVKIDAKTVRFRFSAPNADWRSLFQFVLPKHVLAGHDFDQVWRNGIDDPATHEPIGSGPFLVTGWTRGHSLTAARNPRWRGQRPFLDSIEFRIVPTGDAQFQAIRDGTLDLIAPQPQVGIADLRNAEGVSVQSAPGTTMEHLDFNVGSDTMPLLREAWFRQAIAYAIDRPAVAAASHDFLVPNHPALHNLSFSSVEPDYEPVFGHYLYDVQTVAGLLGAHGCARAADGIWSCDGIRASVRFATTAGNALRAFAQDLMIAQARAAGIELVPDNSPPGFLFGTRLPARQYELIMFAWVRLASLPSVRALYGCGGEQNFMGYCSPAVTDLGLRAEVELDPAVRAQLINDANRLLAADVPSIPLFMRPTFLVHRTALRGPEVNPGNFPTWNAETWRVKR